MVYEDNPFNSPEGQMLLAEMFDLIYLTDPSDRNVLEENNLHTIVNHFRNGQPQVTTLMRQFFGGYKYQNAEKSFQSGILVCANQECRRRDFVFNWEHVDFGVITGIEQWLGSVGLKAVDGYGAQRGFLILARVRCNRYTSCGECGFQVAGKWGSCKACKSSKKIHQGGCGTEHYTINYVVERSIYNLWATDTQHIKPEQMVWAIASDGSAIDTKAENTRPMYYRLVYKGPAKDIMMDPYQVCEGYHIPMLEVGYSAEGGKWQRPYGFECDECGYMRYAPYADANYPWGKPMGGVQLNKSYDQDDISRHSTSGAATGGIYLPLLDAPCAIDTCSGVLKPRMQLPAKHEMPSQYQSNFVPMQYTRTRNALPMAYPITPMKYAFTREIAVVSDAASRHRYYGRYDDDGYVRLVAQQDAMMCLICHRLNYKVGYAAKQSGISKIIAGLKGFPCGHCSSPETVFVPKGRRLSHCPETGSNQVKAHPAGVLFKPKRYNFVPAPGKEFWQYQPTDAKNVLGGFGVYATYLSAPDDTEDYYNMRVDQAVLFSSRTIPDTIDEGEEAGQGITYCPNDQMAENTAGETLPTPGRGCCTLADGSFRVTTEYNCDALRGTYAGDGIDCPEPEAKAFPCSGVSSTNFSYLVAEGHSSHGWIGNDGWKDDSPPCRSYRDPKTFKEGKNMFEYPRWISAPWYDTRVINGTLAKSASSRYKWCEPAPPHVLMDPWHTGSPITATTPGEMQVPPMSTHRIKYLGLMQDPIMGSQMAWHCNTCESICRIGSEREKKGLAKSLIEAWENGTYSAGVAALDYRVNRVGQYRARISDQSPGPHWETFPALNVGSKVRKLWLTPTSPEDNPVITLKEKGGLNLEIEFEQADMTGHGGGWWNWGTTAKNKNAMASAEDIVLF
jgi:hypothetical protein